MLGPEETPYANGCFFFDMHLPDYPHSAPAVKFLTTGRGLARFNPNLYQCGKVCLSLLGTWSGPGWIPGESTLLQVLVSIQGLILGVAEPYFNEPAYEGLQGTSPAFITASHQYNTMIRRYTLQYAITEPLKQAVAAINMKADSKRQERQPETPASSTMTNEDWMTTMMYPEFAEVIVRHFAIRSHAIETQLQEWTAADPSLVNLALSIRADLGIVTVLYDSLVKRDSAALDAISSKPKPTPLAEGAAKRARTSNRKLAASTTNLGHAIIVIDDC